MDIGYRPARREDLEPALRIVQDAYNDLRARHGLTPNVGVKPPSFQAFCLARDPEGLWVAEADDGALVGFGFAWTRRRFWYLAQLFVRPGTQGEGIGRALLARTMRTAERDGARNCALVTMAYNTASTGLYLRNGLCPREPLLRMAAPVRAIEAGASGTGALEAAPIEPWPGCREWLGRIDEEVLGFRREEHHAFLLGGPAARAVRIERAGRPAGYAYVSAEGHIGPLAVVPGADPEAVVDAAVRCAVQQGSKQVSMIVPGKADKILAAVSGMGFRIDEPFVLLSAKPFGDWRHYLPSNPGFM